MIKQLLSNIYLLSFLPLTLKVKVRLTAAKELIVDVDDH